MSPPLRFVGAAAAFACVLAAGGAACELSRFGASDAAAVAHLQREVREQIDRRAARVQTLAESVVANPQLIADAVASRDALPALFARLASLVPADAPEPDTVTIYVSDRPGTHRVLAWSDGPAGGVDPGLLNGAASIFVARGSAGLRLMFIQPLETGGRRLAVAVAETVLASAAQGGAALFPTSYGDVTIVPPPYAGATSLTATDGFVVNSPAGGTLLEVRFRPADPAADRREMRRRSIALAALPLALSLLVAVGPLIDRRRRARPSGGVARLVAGRRVRSGRRRRGARDVGGVCQSAGNGPGDDPRRRHDRRRRDRSGRLVVARRRTHAARGGARSLRPRAVRLPAS